MYTQEDEISEGNEAVDSQGIPGWEKVDRLARALLCLSGLCVTNTQAAEIQQLYSKLLDYDKKTYHPSAPQDEADKRKVCPTKAVQSRTCWH